jgi:hypothetical protein
VISILREKRDTLEWLIDIMARQDDSSEDVVTISSTDEEYALALEAINRDMPLRTEAPAESSVQVPDDVTQRELEMLKTHINELDMAITIEGANDPE